MIPFSSLKITNVPAVFKISVGSNVAEEWKHMNACLGIIIRSWSVMSTFRSGGFISSYLLFVQRCRNKNDARCAVVLHCNLICCIFKKMSLFPCSQIVLSPSPFTFGSCTLAGIGILRHKSCPFINNKSRDLLRYECSRIASYEPGIYVVADG